MARRIDGFSERWALNNSLTLCEFGLFCLTCLFLLLPAFPTAAQELKSDIAEALNTGDTAKAIELLNHSVDIDKGYYYNYAVLGQIYYKQMKCQLAKENFELALDKKSKHYESLSASVF